MRLEIIEKAKKIRVLLLDVDGVLTDGSIFYLSGRQEIKAFFVHDGLGIRMANRAGILVAFVSARESEMVARRASELQVAEVHQRVEDKISLWEGLLDRYQLSPENVAVMGDDLTDLPLLSRAGLSIAVANAVEEVKGRVDLVTEHEGGRGAVREVTDLLLRAQGQYEEQLSRYLDK